MTSRFFNKSEELRRLHEGPLGRHIDDYATLLVKEGYLRTPARAQLRLIADFSRWLHLQRLGAKDLNQQRTEQYLRDRKRSVRIKLGDAACLRRLLKLLRDLGIADHEPCTIPAGEYERLADEFKHYLFKERSLAAKTVVDQLLMARRFLLECFGGGSIRLDQLCPLMSRGLSSATLMISVTDVPAPSTQTSAILFAPRPIRMLGRGGRTKSAGQAQLRVPRLQPASDS